MTFFTQLSLVDIFKKEKEMDHQGFPGGSDSKESSCSAREQGSVPGSGEGHGSPLHYSCLENSIDRGAWRATVLRVGHA